MVIMRFKITALFLLLFFTSAVKAQESLTVDLSVNNGPVTYRASGFLHGMNSTTPSDALVSPMKARLFRFDDNVAGNSGGGIYGINPTFYSRIVGQGAKPMYILLHAWIDNVGGFNPANARVIHAGDIANWQSMVATSVNDAISRGQTVQWDIFNEPDITDFWTGTEAEAFAAWKAAVQTIRGIDPNQKIVGPSTCCSNSTSGGWIVDLLAYAKTNNVLPDILDFHEASFSPSQLATDVAAWNKFLPANYPSITSISVSEYGEQSTYLLPGTVIQYMAAAERTQVYEASHTCWNGAVCESSVATLSEFIHTDQTTINAVWYAAQGYANITGTIVGVTPSATVDGIAGQDPILQQAYSVFGRAGGSGNVTVAFENVSSAAYLNNGGSVHVVAYLLVNDSGNGSSGPTQIIDADMPVNSNSTSVTIPNMGANDVAIIQLTAGSNAASKRPNPPTMTRAIAH
jgi:hypothetical protein